MPQSTNTPAPLERLRDTIRRRHLSDATEQAYVAWCRRYILYHDKKHPDTRGEDEIRAFLSHLPVDRDVSASTQNQALNALVFLYSQVLERDLGAFGRIERTKRPERLPVVLSREEVKGVLSGLTGTDRLIGDLLYGAGLRVMEALRLRVKDVDFGQRHLLVRDGKGGKDRAAPLPVRAVPGVELPFAIAEKYPKAGEEWGWQWVLRTSARCRSCSAMRM